MNKKVLIGLGVLAVAGIGVYMWKRRKDGETSEKKSKSSNARGVFSSVDCPYGCSCELGKINCFAQSSFNGRDGGYACNSCPLKNQCPFRQNNLKNVMMPKYSNVNSLNREGMKTLSSTSKFDITCCNLFNRTCCNIKTPKM